MLKRIEVKQFACNGLLGSMKKHIPGVAVLSRLNNNRFVGLIRVLFKAFYFKK